MKRYFIAIAIVLSTFFSLSAIGRDKNFGKPHAIMAEVGKPGTVVVKVWSYNKSAKIEDNIVFENAIRCIIFDGIDSDDSRHIKGRPALAAGTYEENQAYFDIFFSSKDYMQYCTMAMEGYVEQGSLLKLKKEYKIGKIVVVQYDQLRKRLVADGIIRGLDSVF